MSGSNSHSDDNAERIARRITAAVLRWLARGGIFVTRTRNLDSWMNRIASVDPDIRFKPNANRHEAYDHLTALSVDVVAKLNTERDRLHGTADELKRTTALLDAATADLASAREALSSLESESSKDLGALQNQLAETQGAMRALELRMENERRAHDAQRIKFLDDLNNAKAEATHRRGAMQALEAERLHERESHEHQKVKLRDDLSLANTEAARVRGAMQALEAERLRERAAHEADTVKRSKELNDLQGAFERLRGSNQTFESLLKQEQEDHRSTKADLGRMTGEIERERREAAETAERVAAESAAHEATRNLLENTSNDFIRLRATNASIETQLFDERASHKVARLELENKIKSLSQALKKVRPLDKTDDEAERAHSSTREQADGHEQNSSRPLATVIWDVNTRLYTESEFLVVREELERSPKISYRKAVGTLEKLRQASDEEALRDYFLAISDRVISTNHHLPGFLKYSLLRKIGRALALETFVETGTFYADACRFLRDDFHTLYTIDIDPWCVGQATRLSKRYPQVHPLRGDSGEVLRSLAPTLAEATLFFLDGHFTPKPDLPEYGSMSSKTFGTTPVIAELSAVAARRNASDAIVIDDVGCFENSAQTHYPSTEEVLGFCKKQFKSHRCTLLYGMFFIVPKDAHIQIMGHDV